MCKSTQFHEEIEEGWHHCLEWWELVYIDVEQHLDRRMDQQLIHQSPTDYPSNTGDLQEKVEGRNHIQENRVSESFDNSGVKDCWMVPAVEKAIEMSFFLYIRS